MASVVADSERLTEAAEVFVDEQAVGQVVCERLVVVGRDAGGDEFVRQP